MQADISSDEVDVLGRDIDDAVHADEHHPGIDDILHSLGHSRAHQSASGSVTSTSTPPLPHPPLSQSDIVTASDLQEIQAWTIVQLQSEVLKLRREVRRLNPAFFHEGDTDTTAALGALRASLGDGHVRETGANVDAAMGMGYSDISKVGGGERGAAVVEGEDEGEGEGSVGKEKKKGRKKRKREEKEMVWDDETGKRVEKARRTELGKAIREKIREAVNIGPDDPLPLPVHAPEMGIVVPNWALGLNTTNCAWLEQIIGEVYTGLVAGIWPKVPPEDIEIAIIRSSARTAFQNLAKRFHAENDPAQALKKERYGKSRRRWARKDLKQKRRAKAALDSSLSHVLIPPSALHLDYMSSEYSSTGEDTEAGSEQGQTVATKREERKRRWDAMRAGQSEVGGDNKGWAEGLGEKVLEVRTPRWRSDALNQLYAQLDALWSAQSNARANPNKETGDSGKPNAQFLSTNSVGTGLENGPGSVSSSTAVALSSTPRAGHVAPSHHRFRMPRGLGRKGKKPRGGGEEWMWRSGEVGVWPEPDQVGDEEAVEESGAGGGTNAAIPISGMSAAARAGGAEPQKGYAAGSEETLHGDGQQDADAALWRDDTMGLVNALHELEGRAGVEEQ